jgi:hypothetical protein
MDVNTRLDATCTGRCGGKHTRNYLLLSAAVTVTYGLVTANSCHFSLVC